MVAHKADKLVRFGRFELDDSMFWTDDEADKTNLCLFIKSSKSCKQ